MLQKGGENGRAEFLNKTKKLQKTGGTMVPPERIELSTSPLPMEIFCNHFNGLHGFPRRPCAGEN